MTDRVSSAATLAVRPALAHAALDRLLAFGCVLLLFGDYLTLTISRATSGSAGNWLLFTAILQLPLLGLAVLVDRLDRRALTLPVLAMLGIGAVIAGHVAAGWLSGEELSDYAADKALNWFGVCLPALACGMAIGRLGLVERPTALLWFATPLWAMCAAALAIDPVLLTVAHYADLAIFLGVFVLPAHQALAFSLAKLGLCAFARADAVGGDRRRRLGWLVAAGLTFGLLLLTGARTYLLGAVAAFGLLSWFAGRRVGRALLMVGVGVVLLLAFPSELISERIDPWRVAQSLSFTERTDLWGVALEAFAEYPLFGAGPGGFAARLYWGGRAYPHNLLLEFLSELGLVGGGLFLATMIAVFARIVRLARARCRPTPTQAFAMGFFVFAVVGGLAVGDWMRNSFLFLATGMCLSALPASARGVAR